MLRNCFLDFAVEYWFGCRTTEPDFAGDIGVTEIWFIDITTGMMASLMEKSPHSSDSICQGSIWASRGGIQGTAKLRYHITGREELFWRTYCTTRFRSCQWIMGDNSGDHSGHHRQNGWASSSERSPEGSWMIKKPLLVTQILRTCTTRS